MLPTQVDFQVISACVFAPPQQKPQMNHQPFWWPFVRLHIITALKQKKNSLLSGFLKLSQLLLLSCRVYHWAGAGTEQEWRGEKSVKRGKTSARKWSPELTANSCERGSDAFNTSSAEAMTTWNADIISYFPLQHEKGGEPTPTHSRPSSALAKHIGIFCMNITGVLIFIITIFNQIFHN